MNTIVITNVTYNKVITTLPLTTENEKKADSYARQQNIMHPLNGMVSVHYI